MKTATPTKTGLRAIEFQRNFLAGLQGRVLVKAADTKLRTRKIFGALRVFSSTLSCTILIARVPRTTRCM